MINEYGMGVKPSSEEFKQYLIQHDWNRVMAEITNDDRDVLSVVLQERVKGNVSDYTLSTMIDVAISRAVNRAVKKMEQAA